MICGSSSPSHAQSATAPPTLHIPCLTALLAQNRTVHVFAVNPYENVVATCDLRRGLAEFKRLLQPNLLVGGGKGSVGGEYAFHFSSFMYFESLIEFYMQLAL